jgi:isopenicillin N synthase-like dioxygenase
MEDLRRSSSNRHCKLGSQLSTAKEELLKACKEWGTFHIVNHAIPMELIERYQALMMKIFSLPLEHKLKAKRSQFSVFGYEYRQNSGPLDIFQVGDQDAIIHYYARKFFPDSCPSEFR